MKFNQLFKSTVGLPSAQCRRVTHCFVVLCLLSVGSAVAQKKVAARPDAIFTNPQVEAEFAGGAAAWQRFLNKHLRFPHEAIDNEWSSTVVAQFIVYKNGKVGNINIVSRRNTALGKEVIRVIQLSDGMWTPAIQNGKKVNSYKKQPITICLETEETPL